MVKMDEYKTQILVVDDTPQQILALEAVLGELGQEIITATSPDEALRHILNYDFAVILLDVHMPIMNGFEVARLIRSRKKSSYTPIIFLSAINKDDKNINEGYSMGAVDYVFKPIDPVILRAKVKVFVDLYTKSSLAINLQHELRLRKQAEEQTLKQQRLLELTEVNRIITMEEVTSAMAHEINQPLTVINTYIQGCIHRLKDNNTQKQNIIEVLEQVTKQVERAGAILHRVRNFIRKQNTTYQDAGINELISEIIPFLSESITDSGIQLVMDLADVAIPQLSIDKVQFEQVLLNLIMNSIEALKSNPNPEKKITIETLLNKDKTISINIKDNGPGIPLTHIPKVFDLYFTTKLKGMGLGLGICRTIIETHGGHIIAKNNASGGACFQITLPHK